MTAVVEALDDQVDPLIREDLQWLGERLLWLADERGIGPATTRLSMAAVAVYAAGRLIHGRLVTQQEMADTASVVLETSKSRIGMYAPELLATYEAVFESDEPAAALGCGSEVIQAD